MSRTTAGATRPWTPGALRLTLAANALAAILLFLGWHGAAHEPTLKDGTPWMNLSAIGLVLAAFGNARLLLISRSRIGLRQRALRRSRQPARATRLDAEHRRVALPGGRLYHRPACRLVIGKPAEVLSNPARTGLEPCGWCRP
jgi:hypothetical protein